MELFFGFVLLGDNN